MARITTRGTRALAGVAVAVALAVLAGCGGGSDAGSLDASGEESAPSTIESADRPSDADAVEAQEEPGASAFCDAFSAASELRNSQLVAYLDEIRNQPTTSLPADQTMDGVMDAAGGMFAFASVASIEMWNSLEPVLPPEIGAAVEEFLAINRIYADGQIPPEAQIDDLDDASNSIASFVNERCGLDITSGDL